MAFKVILAEAALADFEQLMNWSLDKYPDGREKFGTALLNHIELLRSFPLAGAPVKAFPKMRRILHSPLYIYYRVETERERIEILRFWHVSRRQPKF